MVVGVIPQAAPRPVGRLGRNPGHIPNGLRDLTWYVAGSLPAAPLEVTPPVLPVSSDGTPWGMDGNDTYGDCGVAGIDHGELAVDAQTGVPLLGIIRPSRVIEYYLKYTGGVDNGVVLSDFLGYVKDVGFYGRKLAGYAPVSTTDYATLQFVINGYGYAYTGIQVTDLMQQAFSNHQPWTAADFVNGNVIGGHCIPLVGYDSNYLYAVTWGSIQPIQWSAWHLISEEAWACIWGEIPAGGLDKHGVSLAALEADINKLTV
jgi:hypothetical protein